MRAPTCSNTWDDPALPAWGTAQRATFVLALEQPGPWGRQALTESRLDAELGARLSAACKDAGGLALLVRRPGRTHPDESPTVLLSGGPPADPWLLSGPVADPSRLLDLPWTDLSAASADDVRAAMGELAPTASAVLVCANGKRDVCCAVRGLPVADAAAAVRPGVWEATHLGGHRFAPTAVVLPTRHALARVSPSLLVEAADAAASGRLGASSMHPFHFRGLMGLDQRDQAADAAVRVACGENRPGALAVGWQGDVATLTHVDGRSWRVAVAADTVELPLSCGKASETSTVWRPRLLDGDAGTP